MMKSERFDFLNEHGEKLAGRLELPSQAHAFAIFAHCFTCGKNIKAASRISRTLASHGIGVLRFDFTGLGSSEGDFAHTNFSSNLSDIKMAAEELAQRYEAPKLLIGHSLGGTAVLKAATDLPSVKAVVTIGSPAEPAHVTKLFGGKIDEIESDGEAIVDLAGREFKIKKQFVEDVRQASLVDRVGSANLATLIFHSPQDTIVHIEQARLIYQSLKHPKSFISLDGADHLLSDPADSDYVTDTIVAWVDRYVQMPVADTSSKGSPVSNAGVEPGEVVVSQIDKFTNRITTRDHSFVADEPKSVGGSHLGMNPYDILLASLGACTNMTLQMYANHKQIDLQHVEIRLRHEKIHAADCETCEAETGKIDSITKQISVRGNLTPEQVQRLGEIAERCPVNRTLQNEKRMVTEIELMTESD